MPYYKFLVLCSVIKVSDTFYIQLPVYRTTSTYTRAFGLDSSHSNFEKRTLHSLDYFKQLVFNCDSNLNETLLNRIHLDTVLSLVRTDVQDREVNDVIISIPPTYISTIRWMFDTIISIRTAPTPLNQMYITAKRVLKKEGFNVIIKSIEIDPDFIMSQRDVVEIKRKTERCLSELMMLIIAFRSHNLDAGESSDVIFFSKMVLEHISFLDKHFNLLLLCRGVLQRPSARLAGETDFRADSFRIRFQRAMIALNCDRPSVASRTGFPFFTYYLECYYQNMQPTCSLFEVDLKVCRLLLLCQRFDEEEDLRNGLMGVGNDVLQSLRRWLNDLMAFGLINLDGEDEPEHFSVSGFPEELRRNTVAMELLMARKLLSDDGSSDSQTAFSGQAATVGSYVHLLITLVERSVVSQADEQEESRGPVSVITDMKRLMAVGSYIEALSDSSASKRSLKQHLWVGEDGSGAMAAKSSNDDDLWGPTSRRSGGRATRRIRPTGDDDLWAPSKADLRRRAKSPESVVSDLRSMSLSDKLTNSLYLVVSELLEEPSVLSNTAIQREIDDTFQTWRRPHLLLDYLRMHAGSEERKLHKLNLRFLRALWAVSDETVDDIRFRSPGNRRQLDRLSPELLSAWTSDNTGLPGYGDSQTLFMLGEDSSTCLGVRTRQKVTNRGLLSFVLHGNCRVVGSRAPDGRMLRRAVVRLLIDEVTEQPVLFMHPPMGGDAGDLEPYDQASELGQQLTLPVIYAVAPPPEAFAERVTETAASTASDQQLGAELSPLVDYTTLAPFVWRDGVRDPVTDYFVMGVAPRMLHTSSINEIVDDKSSMLMGVRPKGVIEAMNLPPPYKPIDSPLMEAMVIPGLGLDSEDIFGGPSTVYSDPRRRMKGLPKNKNKNGSLSSPSISNESVQSRQASRRLQIQAQRQDKFKIMEAKSRGSQPGDEERPGRTDGSSS